MSPILETRRLWLRQMQLDDLDPLLAVFGDAETMRHYPAPFSRAQVSDWINWNLRNYQHYGYGLWAIVLKKTSEVIGDCGLTWQRVGYATEPELEAGWHIRRDLWNRGLASEAAARVRDYTYLVLGRDRLIAIIERQNLASHAVATKLGMALERVDVLDDKERLIFAMSLPATSPSSI